MLPPLAGPFALLEEADRAELTALGTWQRFERDEVLLRQGDSSRALFLLGSGKVRVVMTAVDGNELLVAVLGRGETVGELSVLDGEPRSATVVAMEPTRALRVDGAAFGNFLLARPKVVVGLLRVLSRRLREADELRLQLSVEPTEQRLARCLLALAAEHGEVVGDEIQIGARVSQADLAAYVGSSREAVNQSLGSFRDGGLVLTGRRSITIVDLPGLRARAGG